MITVRIEHPARNYYAWKQAFDRDPIGRKASGVLRYRVYRSLTELSWVSVELDLATRAEAEAVLAKLRALWAGPAAALISEPVGRLLEVVEASSDSTL